MTSFSEGSRLRNPTFRPDRRQYAGLRPFKRTELSACIVPGGDIQPFAT
jgi:hypothetical protein